MNEKTSTGFAVVDLETTGFGASDRVIEIGVVLTDAAGQVERTWETLVNPDRDISNSFVHGISGGEAMHAPSFHNIVGELADLLHGRRFVAHNAAFDSRMLGNELRRLGLDQHSVIPGYVCTMQITGAINPGAGRGLETALARVGIKNEKAHSPLADAKATAELLRHFIESHQLPDLSGVPLVNAKVIRSQCVEHSTGATA